MRDASPKARMRPEGFYVWPYRQSVIALYCNNWRLLLPFRACQNIGGAATIPNRISKVVPRTAAMSLPLAKARTARMRAFGATPVSAAWEAMIPATSVPCVFPSGPAGPRRGCRRQRHRIDWTKSGSGDDIASLPTGRLLADLDKSGKLKFSLQRARDVTRYAMHIGYLEVLGVRHGSSAQWAVSSLQSIMRAADDLANIGKLAADVEPRLSIYLNRLEPSSRRPKALEMSILTLRGTAKGFTAQQLHRRARIESLILMRARQILQRHQNAARQKSEEVRPGKGAHGNPEHEVFFPHIVRSGVTSPAAARFV
jgi:hypothetical protein